MNRQRLSARRRKPSAGSRMRPFWLPIAAGVLLVAGITVFVWTWSGFEPSRVEVTGNRVVPAAEIAARAGVLRNVNMWLQNTGAMANRVATIPYIAKARVYRIPPSSIVVAVRERTPFAVVATGTLEAVVDRDLRILEPSAGGGTLPRLVVAEPDERMRPGRFLTDAKAVALRDDYEAMIAAHVVPLQLEFDRYDGLVATVRGNVRIMFGDDADLAKKLPLVDPILAQVVRKQRRVAAIDLRAPGTPVIVFR